MTFWGLVMVLIDVGGGGAPPPLWGMSKGEAMRPGMRMSACIQERGCEMLGVDAGES